MAVREPIVPRIGTLADVERAVRALEASVRELLRVPVVQGTLLEDVPIGTSETVVAHRLGRAPRGWIVAGIDEAATLHESGARDAQVLRLTASAAAVVDLWVF